MPSTPDPSPRSTLRRWWDEFAVAPLRRAEDEARGYRDSPAGRGVDGKTLTVLVSAAVLLTLQRFLTLPAELDWTVDLLRAAGLNRTAEGLAAFLGPAQADRLERLAGWAVGCVVCYFAVPALIVRLVFRERLADYGVKLHGAFADGWVYLVMVAVMAPLVLFFSRTPQFQETYPFYRTTPGSWFWPGLLLWELLYAVQFFCLEFFFRGFLVHGLRHRFGAYAIPVMTVPYCLIHFHKPLPEALASIAAGLALGFMSLKTRSVALGTALHVTVAASMDFASLWRRGAFG
jgi:membrane protease YdiL (CAAX protease family)